MPDIVIVKKQPIDSQPQSVRDAVRAFLFGVVDGLGELNESRWRRFWRWVSLAEPGELFHITTRTNRLGWYHRKHMLLETRLFEAQERVRNFDVFRVWLKIGAGHCHWLPGPKGGIVPVPKSISYGELEQGAFHEYHEAVVAFVRTPHAQRVLWPKANAADAAGFVEQVLEGLDA